jgi:Putative peptidoglycan binding domain
VRNTLRAAAAGLLAAAIAGALMLPAAPASAEVAPAALPQCQTYQWFTLPIGGNVQLPDINQNINCWLADGSNNSGVYALQRALNKCYYQGLYQDGVYGNLTRQAVRNVQAQIGAVVDGEYGPETRTKMQWPIYYGDGYLCDRLW